MHICSCLDDELADNRLLMVFVEFTMLLACKCVIKTGGQPRYPRNRPSLGLIAIGNNIL